jgi:hypothetical protein
MGVKMFSRGVPTVGYFPRSFPRDPIDVNIYLEHLLLRQVIEPLLECSLEGEITAGVAERCVVNEDFTSFEFTLRQGIG